MKSFLNEQFQFVLFIYPKQAYTSWSTSAKKDSENTHIIIINSFWSILHNPTFNSEMQLFLLEYTTMRSHYYLGVKQKAEN